MYTPSQLRALRVAVIAMGIILLLGFATVIGRIVYLLNAAPNPEPSTASAAPGAAVPLRAPTPVELPKGAVVRHLAISGNRLAIHFEAPSGAGIRIVDLVSPAGGITLPIIEAP